MLFRSAEWLVVGAAEADLPALRAELAGLGVAGEAEPGGGIRIPVGGPRAPEVLRAIHTPLTFVRTHAPTLEDAYLEIVGRSAEAEGEAAEGSAPEGSAGA